MIDFYAFSNDSYLETEVYPHSMHDRPFVFVEPITGTTVANTLKLVETYRLNRDYWIRNLYEVVEGKGLYLPFYEQYRSTNVTYHKMRENYDGLMFMERTMYWGP
jgi:hypothetical protein